MPTRPFFPTLVGPDDVILSDGLNHASIIDGMRLMSKSVTKKVYGHSDLDQLESLLKQTQSHPVRWVVTDGVFSMEGDVARLPGLAELCREYDAMLIVDDSHGVGVLGKTGRGTHEHFGMDSSSVDVFTGTLGKALGGAAGGYVAASRDAISTLEQRARPGLFSNALPATVAYSAAAAIDVLDNDPGIVAKLHGNVQKIRDGLAELGFDCTPSPTAIIPIMIGDEAEAINKSAKLLEMGVMVNRFRVPGGTQRGSAIASPGKCRANRCSHSTGARRLREAIAPGPSFQLVIFTWDKLPACRLHVG